MLAKRTVGVQAGGDSLANRRIGKRTPGILFDFSPAMVQVLKTVGIVVALLVLLAIMHGLATKMGYEVVNAQHQVVQLKKIMTHSKWKWLPSSLLHGFKRLPLKSWVLYCQMPLCIAQKQRKGTAAPASVIVDWEGAA